MPLITQIVILHFQRHFRFSMNYKFNTVCFSHFCLKIIGTTTCLEKICKMCLNWTFREHLHTGYAIFSPCIVLQATVTKTSHLVYWYLVGPLDGGSTCCKASTYSWQQKQRNSANMNAPSMNPSHYPRVWEVKDSIHIRFHGKHDQHTIPTFMQITVP